MKVRPSADLAESIRRGLPLTVAGQIALPAPLAGIVVLVRGGPVPGGLSLAAVLQPRTLLRVPEMKGLKTTRRRNGEVVEGSFAVTPGLLNQLVVACGAWPLVVPRLNPSTPAYPVPDAAAVERGLDAREPPTSPPGFPASSLPAVSTPLPPKARKRRRPGLPTSAARRRR